MVMKTTRKKLANINFISYNRYIIFLLLCIFKISISDSTNSDKQYPKLTLTPLDEADIPEADRDAINDAINKELSRQHFESTKKTTRQFKFAQWMLESSMDNAPTLLKGIFFYLQSRSRYTDASEDVMTVPSFNRLILVGPPGSGKTTLALAIANKLGYSAVFIGASSLLGRYRNETAKNIQEFLERCTSDGLKKIIIIDELHRLFEQHDNDHSDDAQSATAFWLALDNIEKLYPNIIIIGTANNVNKLPPEIKSRFAGKIITMSSPSKKQKIQAFKESIAHDDSVILDESVTDAFIAKMLRQIQNCSLRDIQLIIDTAKMFNYAEEQHFLDDHCVPIITLTKNHFQQALDQLQAESQILRENFADQVRKKLEPWGLIFSLAANVLFILRTAYYDVVISNMLNYGGYDQNTAKNYRESI